MTKVLEVRAQRVGKWWVIAVPDVPGAFAQAKRFEQVEAMARDAVALVLDVAPNAFELDVRPVLPKEAQALIDDARSAQLEAAKAKELAAKASKRAVDQLTDSGWSIRDVGSALGISHQRVSQLAPRRAKAKTVKRSSASSWRVEPRPRGRWAVQKEGSTRASRVVSSKQAAITIARSQAERQGAELVIMDGTSQIAGKVSHGRDTRAAR
jgi:predicted RNase H-like HicB family nuclease